LAIGNLAEVMTLVAYARGKAHGRAFRQFLAAKCFQAVAWTLIVFRGEIPDILSADLGNTLLIAGFALEALALTTTSLPNRRWEIAYGICAGFWISAFWLFANTPNLRVATASIATTMLFGTASIALLRDRQASLLRRSLGLSFGVFSLVLMLRASLAFTLPTQFDVLLTHPVQTLSFLPVYLMVVVGGIGFLLMLKETNDKQLAESEERYRTLVDKAQEAVLIVQNGVVVFANPRSYGLFHVSNASLLGKNFFDFLRPDDNRHDQHDHCDSSIFTDSYDAVLVGTAPDSSWVFVSTSTIAWEGKPARFCVLMDISERK
jgi:PAS domain S-box-containing protein